jgi:hypothetical protein
MLPGESDLFIGDGKRDVKVVTVRRAAVLVVSTALAACSGSENSTTDSAAGNVGAPAAAVDTGMNNAATPVAGGTEEITPTDAKSVEHATEYKLTEQNFRQFVAASDSLVALRRRDPAVRALFDKEVSDAGVNTQVETMNAGRKRLEDNAVIAQAIESTGMSAKDYFVASIAVAQASGSWGTRRAHLRRRRFRTTRRSCRSTRGAECTPLARARRRDAGHRVGWHERTCPRRVRRSSSGEDAPGSECDEGAGHRCPAPSS